jgi:hypothetical protein
MKMPMMYEKIATPNIRTNAQMTLSMSFLGAKSPNPTVDSEVKEKYITIMVLSILEISSVSKP